MRAGGISNKNIKNIFLKMRDISIMRKFKLNTFKCILIKIFQKLNNFFNRN